VSAASTASLGALLAPLRADPAHSAVLSDVDGTLAPIVDDPAAATVPDAARDVLGRLCERYVLVACVTGRRPLEARRIVGVDGIVYAGNHGLEVLDAGSDEPVPAPGLGDRAGLAGAFVTDLDASELARAGLIVEDKGPIQALHWRRAGDALRARDGAERIAAAAQDAGLIPHWGRKVLELRPTSSVDKGSAVRALLANRDIDLAAFGGDDRTDLDAFDALDGLVRAGELECTARIGVDSEEAPEGLADRCDAVVAGTTGFLEALRLLAGEG
jgi:trehalose-phosphatase